MADGKERWRANGRLERTFAVRMDDGVAISESQFPFTLHLPQRGQWEREVEGVKASGDPGLGDWRSAEVRLHLSRLLTPHTHISRFSGRARR